VHDARRNERQESLIHYIAFAIDIKLYFCAEVFQVFRVGAEKAENFRIFMGIGFRAGRIALRQSQGERYGGQARYSRYSIFVS
jgi:hypothetical protein